MVCLNFINFKSININQNVQLNTKIKKNIFPWWKKIDHDIKGGYLYGFFIGRVKSKHNLQKFKDLMSCNSIRSLEKKLTHCLVINKVSYFHKDVYYEKFILNTLTNNEENRILMGNKYIKQKNSFLYKYVNQYNEPNFQHLNNNQLMVVDSNCINEFNFLETETCNKITKNIEENCLDLFKFNQENSKNFLEVYKDISYNDKFINLNENNYSLNLHTKEFHELNHTGNLLKNLTCKYCIELFEFTKSEESQVICKLITTMYGF